MTFKSKKVTPAGEGELSIVGDLTLHGVTKEVVLNVEGPTPEGKDPWGNLRIGASATTKIKRSDFGLTWNKGLETGGVLVGIVAPVTLPGYLELEIALVAVAVLALVVNFRRPLPG